jgi:hypothetical protein
MRFSPFGFFSDDSEQVPLKTAVRGKNISETTWADFLYYIAVVHRGSGVSSVAENVH